MIGGKYQHICVRHLAIEAHTLLEAAHVLHAAHPFILGDDRGLCLLSECLHLHAKLCLVNMWHLGAESLCQIVTVFL